MEAKVKVFFAYDDEDEKIKTKLSNFLDPLSIQLFERKSVLAGHSIEESIKNFLEESKLILVLLSQDFLVDQKKLLGKIISEYESKVIPILIRDCLWEDYSGFKDKQVLPRNLKPLKSNGENIDRRLKEIANEVRKRIVSIREEQKTLVDNRAINL